MKKIFAFCIMLVCVFANFRTSGQCIVNHADTVLGFTPPAIPCIMQDSVYGEAVQVHVPAAVTMGVTLNIDSIKITGITGLPASINYTPNPVSATIPGGGNGCLWYSGTTNATIGNYPLTFHVKVWIRGLGAIDTTLNSFGINYSLNVCGAPIITCDTIRNFSTHDTGTVYYASGYGYVSGTNQLGFPEVAEKFTAPFGAHVTGATLAFGACNIDRHHTDTVSNVTVYVYDTDTTGLPVNVIDSGTIPLLTIAQSIAFHSAVLVDFPNQPNLSGKDFFISVLLPANPIDSIALISTTVHSTDGRGWLNATSLYGSWITLDSAVGLHPPFHIGLYIIPNTCGGAPAPSFSSATHKGCGDVTVHFIDMSSNSPNLWNWTFTGGTPSSSTAQNPTVTYSAPGAYAVKLIAANASGSFKADSVNYVVVYPIVNSDSIKTTNASSGTATNGVALVFSVSGGTPPYHYLWSNSLASVADSNLVHGIYYVTITDANGCQLIDTAIVSFVNGIMGIESREMKIYPNPAYDQLNIQWSSVSDAEITMTDLSGKEVKTFKVSGLLSSVDIHDLASGIYIIHITDKLTREQKSVKFSKL